MKKETGTEGMAKVKGLEVCKGGWVYRGVCVFREGVWRERERGGGLGDRWKYSKVQGPQKEREKGNKI